jgi:hypothetical protein
VGSTILTAGAGGEAGGEADGEADGGADAAVGPAGESAALSLPSWPRRMTKADALAPPTQSTTNATTTLSAMAKVRSAEYGGCGG